MGSKLVKDPNDDYQALKLKSDVDEVICTSITKLNLGCGNDIKPDYINLDIVKMKGVDVVHNMEKKFKMFKDNTFEEVWCSHILEHIDNIQQLMEELQRICKPGAKIKIIVPYFASPSYYIDPSHKRLYNYQTFEAFTQDSNYPLKLNYKITQRKLILLSNTGFMRSRLNFINHIINLAPLIYQRFFCYDLPCSELHIELEVNK